MKLLIIHNVYKTTYIGGEDLVFYNEVKALKEVFGEQNIFTYKVENDNANILDIAFNIFYSKKHYKQIYEIVIKQEIDIVHVHNFFPLLSTGVFKAAKDAGAKTVNTLHNYRYWCINGMLYRNKKGICHDCLDGRIRGIIHKCYRNSYLQSMIATFAFYMYKQLKFESYIDYYFVLTEFQKRKVIELGLKEEKIRLKPNFVITDVAKDNCDKKGFIYVGRLEDSKGIVQLINVWKTLDKKYELTIIGSGPLSNFVESVHEENIKYLGKMDNKKTKELINSSKYLLQTSLWYETFGLTIIEAFSVGTPVIGFDIGTRSDFLKNRYNGFICSENELKEVIIKAEEFRDYENLSKNALKSFEAYSETLIMDKQVKLYNEIM